MARLAQSSLAMHRGMPVLQVAGDGVRLVIPPPGAIGATVMVGVFVLFLSAAVYLVWLMFFSPVEIPAGRESVASAWPMRLATQSTESILALVGGLGSLWAFVHLAGRHFRTEVWTISHRGIRQLCQSPLGRQCRYWPRQEILEIAVQCRRPWLIAAPQAAVIVDLADGRQLCIHTGAALSHAVHLGNVFRMALSHPPASMN